jgi:adenine-specific DNA-methyltransferase
MHLKDIRNYNDALAPNSALLAALKQAMPEFFIVSHSQEHDGSAPQSKFDIQKLQRALDEYAAADSSPYIQFVGKKYAYHLAAARSAAMLIPDHAHNLLPQNHASRNVLLSGDNLDVLKHLQTAYHRSVDIIYIDPPYNTGSDGFVYNDRLEWSDDKLSETLNLGHEEIQRIRSLHGKCSHSAWLCMMYPRLRLARTLLKDTGAIFISIDDNEQANLKLLMDEIFGESNFVGMFIRKTRTSAMQTKNGYNMQHDYIICYANDISQINFVGNEKDLSNYTNPDNDPNGAWVITDPSTIGGNSFEITNPYTNKIDMPPTGRGWLFTQEKLKELIDSGKFVFKKEYNDNERGFILKRYKKDLKSINNTVDSLELATNDFLNANATKERNNLFDVDVFPFPKPVELIKALIKMLPVIDANESPLIMDFFAGSGTTAHAVMRLNAEDGGSRRFVLCTLDEPTPPHSPARQAGYTTINQIAKERILRAAQHLLRSTHKPLPFAQDGTHATQDYGFRHYWCKDIAAQTLDAIEQFDPAASNQLFAGEDYLTAFDQQIDGSSIQGKDIILRTYMTADGFDLCQNAEYIEFAGSGAYRIQTHLYIMETTWNAQCTKMLLNQIGANQLQIKIIVIFGYCFDMETLRELQQNIKTALNNRITLQIRY